MGEGVPLSPQGHSCGGRPLQGGASPDPWVGASECCSGTGAGLQLGEHVWTLFLSPDADQSVSLALSCRGWRSPGHCTATGTLEPSFPWSSRPLPIQADIFPCRWTCSCWGVVVRSHKVLGSGLLFGIGGKARR